MAPPSDDECRSSSETFIIPRVGDKAQLWSRTAGAWCDGEVVEVKMGMVVRLIVEYSIPNVGVARKVLLPTSVNVRFPNRARGAAAARRARAPPVGTMAATGCEELEREGRCSGEASTSEGREGQRSAGRSAAEGSASASHRSGRSKQSKGAAAPPGDAWDADRMCLQEGLIVGDGRFELHHQLGSGSFSTVRLAKDLETGREVALKFEPAGAKYPQLIEEARRYRHFTDAAGLPKLHWYGSDVGFNIMAIDLLGPSLEAVLDTAGRQLSLANVVDLGVQVLDCLEFIHGRDFIHRDLKPNNFCMGLGESSNQVFCIDFGLAKRFRAPASLGRAHIPFRGGLAFVGTVRYASVGAQLGEEQSRRDDMQSFAYMLVYLLNGRLPWQGVPGATKDERRQNALEVKQSLTTEDVCYGAPPQFLDIMDHVMDLQFEQEPDYERLRQLLREAGRQQGRCGGEEDGGEALEELGDGASER